MKEKLIAIMATVLLALGMGQAAHAQTTTTQTTSSYSTSSESSDIDLSCKNLEAASTTDGEISGQCNYKGMDGTVVTRPTSIDLDCYFGCNGQTLSSDHVDFSLDSGGIKVTTGSTGNDYLISAVCNDATSASSKEINAIVKNNNGHFTTNKTCGSNQ